LKKKVFFSALPQGLFDRSRFEILFIRILPTLVVKEGFVLNKKVLDKKSVLKSYQQEWLFLIDIGRGVPLCLYFSIEIQWDEFLC